MSKWKQAAALAVAAMAFAGVATLNSGGYRYGIGDQAFYIPAIIQHIDPNLFPRDRQILHAQDRLLLYDDLAAAIVRTTGISLPVLFFLTYLAGLGLLFGAIVAIGRVLYRSWWAVAALAALMTLRHRITQTGANSLEGYFHPRMLAFAVGAWAIAAYLRGKNAVALALVAGALVVHPTTALWFGIWIVAAVGFTEREWRPWLAGLTLMAAVAAVSMLTVGPLAGHLQRIDSLWASAMAGKDYIFPSDWSPSFWLVNLSYLPVAVMFYLARRRLGVAVSREVGLLFGGAALVMVFLISWPFMSRHLAMALQLQTSRTFWMVDFLAALYIGWRASEGMQSVFLRRAVPVILIAVAVARGVVVWQADRNGSAIVRVGLPPDEWTDVMRWISQTAPDAHVLAHPGHAWKYGTSVRVSGERDVYFEEVKDLSVALYSRDVAVESLRRIRDTENFETFTPDRFRSLAGKYDLDYVVLDRDVDLPLRYRNTQFRVYALGSDSSVQ